MNNQLVQKLQIAITTSPGVPTLPPIEGPLKGINTIGDIVNKLITFIFPLAGMILLIVLIWGGYDFLLSRGNPEKIKGAQAKLTSGLIGFILLFLSYFIVKLIASVFSLGDGIL